MTKDEEQKILLKWYARRDTYEEFGKQLRHRIDSDPIFPSTATHLISHRLKDPSRLIEKIHHTNQSLEQGIEPVSSENFEERIEDLLGMKIICLRRSDIPKVDYFLRELEQAGAIKFVRDPVIRKPFTLPTDSPPPQGDVELTYTGYASIHYIVCLGKGDIVRPELLSLKAEIQLRTILDEGWGEIDHKYRYERIRTGKAAPDHIDRLFRTAGWYIQLVAQHLEYACEESDKVFMTAPPAVQETPPQKISSVGVTAEPVPTEKKEAHKDFQSSVEALMGMRPSRRTWSYITRRLSEHRYLSKEEVELKDIFEAKLVQRFMEIYSEKRSKGPFLTEAERELDLVHLVNFLIFSRVHSSAVAEEGLRSRLRKFVE
jgi:putative GTP pyrophosphokinase